MAKILSVEDIKELDKGDVIARFEGTITKFLTWKKGVGKDGNGTLQILLVEDNDGDEIKIKAWDHDRIPAEWEDEKITILAHRGKSGITGVFADDDEYQDKVQRIIRLTGSAEVVKGGSASDAGSDDDDEPRKNKRKADSDDDEDRPKKKHRSEEDDEPPRKHKREEEDEEDPIGDAKRTVMQEANLYALCCCAAWKMGQHLMDEAEIQMTPEHFQAATSSLYITMSRQGWGGKLPEDELIALKSED